MARLALAIIAFVLALAVIKMVIIALVIAGLIFRTKITIGLLLLGGLLTLIAAQPILGLGLTGVLIWVGVTMKKREEKAQLALEDPDQE
jgi:hypothetical protein